MLSKSAEPGGGLVCSQCSQPMDALLRRERPPWSWKDLGSVVLIASFAATAVLLTVIADLVLRQATPQGEAGTEAEAIRIESRTSRTGSRDES
ncbi:MULTISPECIES: hypothetical protein [Aphanothece]|uniref:hypothetical protein n=1 Tax=Aphanothece TaxID=1121 RepID=UPI0039846B6D